MWYNTYYRCAVTCLWFSPLTGVVMYVAQRIDCVFQWLRKCSNSSLYTDILREVGRDERHTRASHLTPLLPSCCSAAGSSLFPSLPSSVTSKSTKLPRSDVSSPPVNVSSVNGEFRTRVSTSVALLVNLRLRHPHSCTGVRRPHMPCAVACVCSTPIFFLKLVRRMLCLCEFTRRINPNFEDGLYIFLQRVYAKIYSNFHVFTGTYRN